MKLKKNKMWQYVIFTYLLFWFLVLGIGGIGIFVFNASPLAMRYVTTICSWAPTIILLIMFKKLRPNSTIKSFYKELFKEKLNFRVFGMATLLIVGIFLMSAYFLSIFEATAISAQLSFVFSALFGNIIFTAIQGASGEESGWRGYLMPELEKKYGFVKGNVILGLIWSFWHLPLWFVSTDYSGMNLLLYIISFVVGLTAFSIIIGVYMKKCNNLLLAFWMHFLFNFVLTFFIGKDLYLLASLAVLYTVAAVVYVNVHLQRN
jgi:membrane protease YdiL (CAAX protease family)